MGYLRDVACIVFAMLPVAWFTCVVFAVDPIKSIVALVGFILAAGYIKRGIDQSWICPDGTTEDKIVLVTGCDSGFGHDVSKKLAKLGFTVFSGCLDAAKATPTFQDCPNARNIHVLQLDVTKDEEIADSLKSVQAYMDKPSDRKKMFWALVNNAGIGIGSLVEFTSMDAFRRHADILYLAPVALCKTFLPLLRKNEGTRVVNLTSATAYHEGTGVSFYAAAKAGLEMFSKCLRYELSPFNIKVVTVSPGFYRTNITSSERIEKMNVEHFINGAEDIKKDYGEQFFHDWNKNSIKKMNEIMAEDITPVINALVNGVASYQPQTNYDPMLWSLWIFMEGIKKIVPDSFMYYMNLPDTLPAQMSAAQ